jgi:hypothetical protein
VSVNHRKRTRFSLPPGGRTVNASPPRPGGPGSNPGNGNGGGNGNGNGNGGGGSPGGRTITYPTWSSTYKNSSVTLSGSDLIATVTAGVGNRGVLSTGPIQGKRYWEVEIVSHASGNIILGLAVQGHKTNVFAVASTFGLAYQSNGVSAAPLNVTYTAGDRIGFAYDSDTGNLWVSKNASWLGSDPTGAAAANLANYSRVLVPAAMFSANASVQLIFRASQFEGSLPSGYSVLEQASFPAYAWSVTDKSANMALTVNNTLATKSSTGHASVRLGTEPCKGKQVWAVELTADGAGSTAKAVALMDVDDNLASLQGSNGFTIGYRSGGTVVRNSVTVQTYTAWGSVGDIIMIATDADTNELWFGLNGVWNGDPAAATGEVGSWIADGASNYGLIACGATDAGDAFQLITFPYTVPSGFTAPTAG